MIRRLTSHAAVLTGFFALLLLLLSSAAWSQGNLPPVVTLVSPDDLAAIPSKATFHLLATATDPDNDPVTVHFYVQQVAWNGTLYPYADVEGELVNGVYTATITEVPIGNYLVYAVASDGKEEGSTTSSQAYVAVYNIDPEITLNPPTSAQNFVSPATVEFTAVANDNHPGFTVTFYIYQVLWDGTLWYTPTMLQGEEAGGEFHAQLTEVPCGNYMVRAIVSDDEGGSATSADYYYTVYNLPPTVTIVSPTAWETKISPATFQLRAEVEDNHEANGVGFYIYKQNWDGTWLWMTPVRYSHRDPDTPNYPTDPDHAFFVADDLTGLLEGTYKVIALGDDLEGGADYSDEVIFIVNNEHPEGALIKPTADQQFAVGQPIELDMEAWDPNTPGGDLQGVGFFLRQQWWAGYWVDLGSLPGVRVGNTYHYLNYATGLPVGIYQIYAVAVDNENAQKTTDPIYFWVVDDTAPTIIAPPDVLDVEQENLDGTAVALGEPVVADNYDQYPQVTNDAPPVFPLGETLVTWTVRDASGNTATDTQRVVVIDTTPPVIPSREIITEQMSTAGTSVPLDPEATDNCDADLSYVYENLPMVFPLGSTDVTVTATDVSGNSATGTLRVTVVDTTPPWLMTPETCYVEQATRAGTSVTLTPPIVYDNCDTAPSVTALLSNGDPLPMTFPLGSTTICWTARDASGNTSTTSQTIVVQDSTPPSITPPADVLDIEQVGKDGTPILNLGQPVVTDACDANPTVTNDAPAVFQLGETWVIWTATDASGNASSAWQCVRIRDTQDPRITPPADLTVEQVNFDGTPVDLGIPVVEDDCDSAPIYWNDAPMVFPLGETVVHWTVMDASGNLAHATQTVTVEDTMPPVVSAQDQQAEQTDAAGTMVWPSISVTDNCDTMPSVLWTPTGPYPLGTTSVTITAHDASGNAAVPVTITITVVDTIPPSLMSPMPETYEQTDRAGTPVPLTPPIATDLCDTNPTVVGTLLGGAAVPAAFPLGTTTVVWTATDASGNTCSVTQEITIVDTTPPELTVPADITAEQEDRNGTRVLDLGMATATDICDAAPVVTHNAPEIFPLGTTEVTWTATDISGNAWSANQAVTVVDTTPPTIVAPDDITVMQVGDGDTTVDLDTPTVSDICDADPLVTCEPAGPYPVGKTLVVWTATDASGNSAIDYQVVEVIDNTVAITAAPKYILANGTDTTTISVTVTDADGVTPKPDVTVQLSTTAGTLSTTTVVSDANGVATATLTASTTPEVATVTAIVGDHEAEVAVTFFKITKVSVEDAYLVPETTPARWGAAIGKEGTTVTITAEIEPADVDLAQIPITWTGGTPDPEDRTVCFVPRDVAAATDVTVTATGNTANQIETVRVVVVKVVGIVPVTDLTASEIEEKIQLLTACTTTPDAVAVAGVQLLPEQTDENSILAIGDRLLFWSGGQAGETPLLRTFDRTKPSKTDVTVTCGVSEAEATVWVLRVSLAMANNTLYPNTDDDNTSATVDPPYNGVDLNEMNIGIFEDDLRQLNVKVEPDGALGQLTFSLCTVVTEDPRQTAGARVALYTTFDKAAALSTIDLVDPDHPREAWVEGCALSSREHDQEITVTYTWAGVTLTASTYATVTAPPGSSSSALRVYTIQKDQAGNPYCVSEKYSPVGGTMAVVLEVKIGPGDRLACDANGSPLAQTATVRIEDTWQYPTDVYARKDLTYTLAAGNWQEYINAGTPQAGWIAGLPNTADGSQVTARTFWMIQSWDTVREPSVRYPGMTEDFNPPMGHNGDHAISLVTINDQPATALAFQHGDPLQGGWQAPYEAGPEEKTATVKNLVITDIRAKYGTKDYLKYDPDPDSRYHRPEVTFSFEDQGDPHTYKCWVMIQPTINSGREFLDLDNIYAYAYAYVYDTATPVVKTLPWTGCVNVWNDDHTGYTLSDIDKAYWGTYTYDVIVAEYDGEMLLDTVAYKWPYCLTVANSLHSVGIDRDDAGQRRLYTSYEVSDYVAENPGYPNFQSVSDFMLIAVDPDLSERACVDGGKEVGMRYDLTVIDHLPNDVSPLPWRVIYTGTDECWRAYRRDHEGSRMLAVNKTTQKMFVFWNASTKQVDALLKMIKEMKFNKEALRDYAFPEVDNAMRIGFMQGEKITNTSAVEWYSFRVIKAQDNEKHGIKFGPGLHKQNTYFLTKGVVLDDQAPEIHTNKLKPDLKSIKNVGDGGVMLVMDIHAETNEISEEQTAFNITYGNVTSQLKIHGKNYCYYGVDGYGLNSTMWVAKILEDSLYGNMGRWKSDDSYNAFRKHHDAPYTAIESTKSAMYMNLQPSTLIAILMGMRMGELFDTEAFPSLPQEDAWDKQPFHIRLYKVVK